MPYEIWLPEQTQNMEERSPDEQLKIAILGPPKGGKSRLAVTAPKKPIYVFDFDGRLASIAGIPGVLGKSYLETTSITKSTAWQEVEKDLGMFEYTKSQGKGIPATFVFDSMTFMLDRADRYVEVNNTSLRREVKLDSTKVFYVPKGFDTYKAEMSIVSNVLARAVELGVDVISVFHERPEEAPDSTQENPKYTGRYSTHPPRAVELLPIFNELWRIKPDNGKYTVYTSPSYEFTGATTLKIDGTEEPDIENMIKKHYERSKK